MYWTLENKTGVVRGPASFFVAGLPPKLCPSAFVQGDYEGLCVVIKGDNDRVAVEGGRRAFTKIVFCLLLAQVFLPLEVAGQVVTVKAAGTEKSIDVLAIGEGR